jgi:hypothetical protein
LSIRSPRWALARQPCLRAALALTLAAVALISGAINARPAHAALTAVAPVNPGTGFPDWYQDATGLKLQPCLDGLPLCSAARAELVAPDGEGFYWRAQGDVSIDGGTAKMALAQEAAFLDGPITFGRIRVTIVGARANTTYSVTHPYGTLTVQTDGLGKGRTSTDFGCGATPCDWNAALRTPTAPFLHWDASAPAPQPGYIGDAATPHRVIGSPTGFNAFRVARGVTAATTNLLTVEGKLAGPPVPVFDGPGPTDFGSTAPGAPVTRTVTVTSFGVPDAAGRSHLAVSGVAVSGPQAPEFTVVGNTCTGAVMPSGATCAVTVQFAPGAAGARSAVLDIAHNAAGGGAHIALGGTGAVPTAAVAGVSLSSRLRISKLRTSHRMSRARVVRRGLRLSMRLPTDTEILKIAVYRVREGRVVPQPVWLGFRVVGRIGRSGLYRVSLDSRALRQRMKVGLYQVNVTPGLSKRQLGRTTSTRVRITRR